MTSRKSDGKIGLLQHQETFKETRRGNFYKSPSKSPLKKSKTMKESTGGSKVSGRSPRRSNTSRSPEKKGSYIVKRLQDAFSQKSGTSSPRSGKISPTNRSRSPVRRNGRDSVSRSKAQLDLSANKQWASLYGKNRDKAQDDPDQIWLRNRSINEKPERQQREKRNPSRRGGRSGADDNESVSWKNPQGVKFGLCLIFSVLLYMFF